MNRPNLHHISIFIWHSHVYKGIEIQFKSLFNIFDYVCELDNGIDDHHP